MKILRILFGSVIGLLALFTAVTRIFQPREAEPGSRSKVVIRTALLTAAIGLALLGIAGLATMYSGVYKIAANEPHLSPVRWALQTGRDRSIQFHSRGIAAPEFRDPELIRHGLKLYVANCEPCHGAPGVPRDQLGRGINPSPPPLMTAVARWTDSQLYWIITNGLKLSGMPSFGVRLSDGERWAIVGFATRMAWLSPADYQRFRAIVEPGGASGPVDWVLADDLGLAQLEREGIPEIGRELLKSLGCLGCHAAPGREQAAVGPPLTAFVERHFIAGTVVNTPTNLVQWILNPQQFEPKTAMPNVGATPSQALHIAAYLYQSGDPKRLSRLRPRGQ